MKVFGITGGVGAGKSEVLTYLGQNYDATACNLASCIRSGMNDHGTLIGTLSKNDPCMTVIISDVSRIYLPACLGQVILSRR